jgi:hypothetical protein
MIDDIARQPAIARLPAVRELLEAAGREARHSSTIRTNGRAD